MKIHCTITGKVGERTITLLRQLEKILEEKFFIITEKKDSEHKVKIRNKMVVVSKFWEGKWKILP